MKQTYFLAALLAMLCVSFVGAIEVPLGIDGHVYALDGITPVPRAVTVIFENLATGASFETRVGRSAPGRYSVALPWEKGVSVRITASNPEHASERTVVLGGILHNVDLFLNMTLSDLPPAILTSPVLSVVQDQMYAYHMDVYEWNNDPLQFGLMDSPQEMLLDDGFVQWSPDAFDIGLHPVAIMVSDGTFTVYQNFTVTVEDVNDPPVFVSMPNTMVDQGHMYEYDVVVEDVDGDTVTLDFSGPAMTLEENVLSWTPGPEDVGIHPITVTATDGVVVTEQSFSLEVTNIPDAPVITSTPAEHVLQDATYTYVVLASDADNDIVTVFVDGPEGMGVQGSTISWVPGNDAVGWHNVTITVTDGQFNVTQEYALEVVNVNDPPSVETPIRMPVLENVALYKLDLEDLDGDAVEVSLLSGPPGLSVSTNGFVRYIPALAEQFVFVVVLSDGHVNVTKNVSASLISLREFAQSGGGGGGLFAEYLPPAQERLFDRTYRFTDVSLFLRAALLTEEIRFRETTPAVPLDKVVYRYFDLIPTTEMEGVEELVVSFSVPEEWIEEHDAAISLHRYGGSWKEAETIENGGVFSASVRGLGLFAIAADTLPELKDPVVVEVPEPTTFVGVIKGQTRERLPLLFTDLDTGETHHTSTGDGDLARAFQLTLNDIKKHSFTVEVNSSGLRGKTQITAHAPVVIVDLTVRRTFLGITGQVVAGEKGTANVQSLLVLVITIALAVRFVRWRIRQ